MFNKLKTFLTASKTNAVVFTVAAALVVTATIGGAKAAIDYYGAEVQMYAIGVSLLENGETVTSRYVDTRTERETVINGKLLTNMLQETGGKLEYGRPYSEELSVHNSGEMDEYVRVDIYRYWEDSRGTKQLTLDPSYIDLHLLTGGNGWVVDEAQSTNERVVLYYMDVLPVDGVTPPFSDLLTIDSAVSNGRTKSPYNGMTFIVEVDVQAVQINNVEWPGFFQ